MERSAILEQTKKNAAAEKQRGDVDARLQTLNQHEVQLADVDRQVAVLEAEYRKAEKNREQARWDDELKKSQISNVNVAQAPSFGAKPVSPSLLRNLFLGAVVAFGGGILVVFQGAIRDGVIEPRGELDEIRYAAPSRAPRAAEESAILATSDHARSNGIGSGFPESMASDEINKALRPRRWVRRSSQPVVDSGTNSGDAAIEGSHSFVSATFDRQSVSGNSAPSPRIASSAPAPGVSGCTDPWRGSQATSTRERRWSAS